MSLDARSPSAIKCDTPFQASADFRLSSNPWIPYIAPVCRIPYNIWSKKSVEGPEHTVSDRLAANTGIDEAVAK